MKNTLVKKMLLSIVISLIRDYSANCAGVVKSVLWTSVLVGKL
jgi:hypothetical protein